MAAGDGLQSPGANAKSAAGPNGDKAASADESNDLVVAGDGIEPPTRGFSTGLGDLNKLI